jgi:uncharacterized damage-inducible protein DinB
MMSEKPASPQPPADANELRERVETSWRQLLRAVDGIADEKLAEPGVTGDWSVKALLGHVAFWDEHALAEVERSLAGQPRQDNDWQAMNDADNLARRERSLAEQRAALDRAHAALRERLAGIADSDAARVDEGIRADTYEHYPDHQAEIARWRRQTGV